MTDILVIEPDSLSRKFLAHTLKDQGYDVVATTTGEEGLMKAEMLRPSVIILAWDISKHLDGPTLCQQLKNLQVLSTTFLLLLTSRYSVADRVKGLEMGADDLLSIPVDVNELRARVRAGLRLNHLARDLQAQKQRLEDDLAEAEAYVRSLLPPDQTGRVPIQGRFVPSQQLGGDGYDYYWLDPDYLAIYLLDVSGHGLGSALLSTSVLNVLRSQSLPDVNFYRPETVLKALNETFQMGDQNQKYFTIWYGVLNCANRQLLYASAGHPPAVLVSRTAGTKTTVERLRTPGMPIGMLPEAKYRWQRHEIPRGASLYLFSDGLYEVQQANDEYLGLDAFIDLLEAAKGQKNVDDILAAINQIQASKNASDDMSLVALTLD